MYRLLDNDKEPLDATIDFDGGELILHSRGGVRGRPGSRNMDYGVSLRLLLQRIQDAQLRLAGAWLDSRDARPVSRDERRILFEGEFDLAPTLQFRRMSDRMQAYGRAPGAPRGGSRVKRVRIALEDVGGFAVFAGLLGIVAHASPPAATDDHLEGGLSVNDDDRVWAEGSRLRALHLRRERAPGLAAAKRAAFIREFGALRCERCGLDPVTLYGADHGAACIEVHHATRALSEMNAGDSTRLEDLRCLCANCHRVVHSMMRSESARNIHSSFRSRPVS